MGTKTILDFLDELAREAAAGTSHISFHMPGHKGRTEYFTKAGAGYFLKNITTCDITEIPGADALFFPQTTIKAVMDNYASLYGVRHTELLVNGSSAGIIAAVMACVPIGGKLIMARNSHHSAFSALRLGGINPVYIRPETDPAHGLAAGVPTEALREACEANPEASAVLITSPNYYGAVSDISRLATIAHSHDMLLIVDQAHGAHLRFFDYLRQRARDEGGFVPEPMQSAEATGADIVINSTHKTLFSFTGSSILNICSDKVDPDKVADVLRMLQTTSPSYLLMGSLDANERIMRRQGPEIMSSWLEDIDWFYKRARLVSGLDIVDEPYMDRTKINISMRSLGLRGEQLDRELRQRGIFSEMVHGDYVMLLTGAGSVRSDYEALLTTLRDISDSYGIGGRVERESAPEDDLLLEVSDVPMDFEAIPLYEADGRVAYDPVIIYPPGSPTICPGEIIDARAIGIIAEAISREEIVVGVDEEGMIRVGVFGC